MPKATKNDETFDYAEKSGELEAILLRLQSGEMQLSEATELYERGVKLADEIEAYLKQAENTVRKHVVSE